MRLKLGIGQAEVIGSQFEDLLTVGSRIFFQTHFYPMIKMQKSAREIFLSFKGPVDSIPVLLNVELQQNEEQVEIHCVGMIISNRNRFEKELIEAKKAAQEALAENAELIDVKTALQQHQKEMESQLRKLKSLKEQQQELFKLITHDLQEPLRKAVFMSDSLLTGRRELDKETSGKLLKIISYNTQMREMLLTLQSFQELEKINLKYSLVALDEILDTAISGLNIDPNDNIVFNYAKNAPCFYGDRQLLIQFFTELIRNSLENRDPEKEVLAIEISIMETQKNLYRESAGKYQYEKFVKINYTDNGAGFLTDNARMFQILQKSVQFNKISIGLAFCKRIIEKHMGTIVAKSVRNTGVGYTIFLPGGNAGDAKGQHI